MTGGRRAAAILRQAGVKLLLPKRLALCGVAHVRDGSKVDGVLALGELVTLRRLLGQRVERGGVRRRHPLERNV